MKLRSVFTSTLVLTTAALTLSAQGARGRGEARASIANAPFSATVTTTLVHPLADGNEIDRTSSYNFYRDSQGRTRHEVLDKNGQVTGVTIVDPVAGKRYVLHPDKLSAEEFSVAPGAGRRGSALTVVSSGATNTRDLAFVTVAGDMVRLELKPPGNSVTEALEPITYQGLNVTGKRTTRTIPAGEIGNRDPMAIVTEQWYSPDLGVYVRTKHSDPEAGTTTTQYDNIQRGDPPASLFSVPAEYTISQPAGRGR